MSIRSFEGHYPDIHPTAYVDPDATVIGEVSIGADSSLWPGTVARGDVNRIVIGARTSIQDGSILHVTHDGPYTPGGTPLLIGDDVTVGHGVILHACTVGNFSLIGMGATIMDDVQIGDHCLIAGGALVSPGKICEPGTLWRGSPARPVRELSSQEITKLEYSAQHYVRLKNRYIPAANDAGQA